MRRFRVVKKHGGHRPQDLPPAPEDGSYYCTVMLPHSMVCAQKAVNLNQPPFRPAFYCMDHVQEMGKGILDHYTVMAKFQMKRIEELNG